MICEVTEKRETRNRNTIIHTALRSNLKIFKHSTTEKTEKKHFTNLRGTISRQLVGVEESDRKERQRDQIKQETAGRQHRSKRGPL